jgi:hypothetical protein
MKQSKKYVSRGRGLKMDFILKAHSLAKFSVYEVDDR